MCELRGGERLMWWLHATAAEPGLDHPPLTTRDGQRLEESYSPFGHRVVDGAEADLPMRPVG